MLTIGVVAAVIGVVISLLIDWFPTRASGSAGQIDTLYDVLLIVSVPIFVLVMTVAIYSVIKFRAKPGDMSDGAPIHGNTKLEVTWVTIPFLLVTGLAIYGWIVLSDIEAKKPDTLPVNVTAQQFTWHFSYPRDGKVESNRLVLPVDRPVEFRIHTKDVIHSFWVPQFRLKSDAVPGLTTRIRVTPDRLGSFEVVCAELCGLGHSTMRVPVRVVSKAAFGRWVASQRKAAGGGTSGGGGGGGGKSGGGGGNASGKQIFTSSGCGSCHTLSDAGTNGNVGPKLDDLVAAAKKFGKRRKESAKAYVKESIVDPRAFTVPGFPGNVMPTNFKRQLSDRQVDTLVGYLLSVSGGKGR
jgi:cytochrome c oxidase subunit 2